MDVNALFQVVTESLNGGIKIDVYAVMAGCVAAWVVVLGGRLIIDAIKGSLNKNNDNGMIKHDEENEEGVK